MSGLSCDNFRRYSITVHVENTTNRLYKIFIIFNTTIGLNVTIPFDIRVTLSGISRKKRGALKLVPPGTSKLVKHAHS
jgi:hypothetical protein